MSPEQRQRVKDAHALGVPVERIAKIVALPLSLVECVIEFPESPPARWTAKEHEAMLALTARGMFAQEVAGALGRTRIAVVNRAYRHGISLKDGGQMKRAATGRRPSAAALAARDAAMTPEVHARRIAAIRATFVSRLIASGIPAERIDEYRAIKKTGVAAPEARRMIAAAVATDAARAARKADAEAAAVRAYRRTFAGQLEAVQAGVPLVERVYQSTREHEFSLTGCSL